MWLLLSVACFIAAFYFWRLGDKWQARTPAPVAPTNQAAPASAAPAATSQTRLSSSVVNRDSTAPVIPPLHPMTNSVVRHSTNFPYRLSNTTQSVGELSRNRKAILLENALIDSSQPVDLAIPDKLRAHGDPGAYIVQADGLIDDAFRARLKAAGVTIVSYIPNNSFLIKATAAQVAPFGPSAHPWEPYYKINSSLMPSALAGHGLPAVNVAVFPNALGTTIAALTQMGVTVASQSPSPFGTELNLQNVNDLAAVANLTGIEVMEPSTARMPENDLSRVILSVSTDPFVPTNYMFLTGSNVLVAVADSWVPSNAAPDFNPDLPNIFGPTNIFNTALGINIFDFDGHATHVGGIIAASGHNSPTNVMGSPPFTDCRGKAPEANIWALPLHGLSDSQLQEAAALTNALISNNSWGYPDNSYNLAAASYDQAVRDSLPGATGSQSLVYVFAAGNNGGGDDGGLNGEADSLTSPAVAKNVISVGASELPRNITNQVYVCDDCNPTNGCSTNQPWLGETDSDDQVASFSSRGNVGIGVEGDSGRYKPDVVAPGTFVVSTRSMTWDTNAYYNPTNDDVTEFDGDTVQTNGLFTYSLFVPCDTAQLIVTVESVNPTNVPLIVYVNNNGFPTPGPPPGNFLASGTNTVSLPPDAALTPTDSQWFFGVGNTTNIPVTYNIVFQMITTNDLGDYFDVLRTNLNDQLLSTNGVFYRYETGTSMSAAAVSGVLALMEDYFTNQLKYNPSPALMKALLINGARSINGQYDFQVTNSINYQGWGLPNLTNSLPVGITSNTSVAAPTFFVDQNTNTALATGDSQTFNISVNQTNGAPQGALRVTLVWTDPPGNPAASIKLVNNLELIVTNTDIPTNPPVFFGNNFDAGNIFTSQWDGDTNNIPFDNINNVQNIYLPPPLGSNYTITVFGKAVNVNAVTANTNGIVQDYALVISWDNGELTNALTLSNNPVIPSYMPDVTTITNEFQSSTTVSGALLVDQHVGASSPLQGTNTLALTNQDNWATNGQITLGVTNQWHFYVVENTNSTGGNFTHAAFLTFLPPDLSIPPVGVNAPNLNDATRPEADIDLYVARASVIPNASDLTNLNPAVIALSDKSLGRGGTEVITYTNAQANELFYVGVKSEDQEAAQYDFAALFSLLPFSEMGPNGEEYLHGINVPNPIPSASLTQLGISRTLALAVEPIQVRRVVVTNVIEDQDFGDLFGTLVHNQITDVLNNHSFGNGSTNQVLIYEDNGEGNVPGSQQSDGPGSLKNFVGQQGIGLWMMTEFNSAIFNTGEVENVLIKLEPQTGSNGVVATIQPNTFFFDFIDVPPEATNLTICVEADPQQGVFNFPLDLFVRFGDFPTTTTFDYLKIINPPGDCLSIDRTDLPPLRPGRYYIGVFNPNSVAETVRISWTFGLDVNGVNPTAILSTNAPISLNEDAVTNSSIFITNNQNIVSVNVGVVLTDPRISDLDLTLVSPTGQRILLMENRGGESATNMGHLNITTNIFGQVTAGGANQNGNTLTNIPSQGVLLVNYNMFIVPDQMDVYDNLGNHLFHSGYVSGVGTFTIPYGQPPVTSLTIIMNQGNNPIGTTEWTYQPNIVTEDFTYLTFTDDTNLTEIPIKYAIPPYDNEVTGTNIILGDFDLAADTNYIANPGSPTNFIPDNSGGWSLTTNDVFVLPTNYYTGTNLISMATNFVTVFSDPLTAFDGSNVLALANGSISRVLSLTPQRNYTINYFYRGPGIAGWWRGEGDASDSGDPETLGNNGYLIGRFNFPAGEVGQAFAMEDSGLDFQFAGTNTYVQARQSPSLNVASNSSGFTVEGWINPTNTTFQQPLAEWLAGLPMSSNAILGQVNGQLLTNFNIVAGPFRNPANNHYYYLLGQTNWQTSEYWAEAMGGHLAQVNDANEENWIYDTFADWGLTNHTMWIGLTNASLNGTSNFVWSTGSSNLVYTNWAAGQPTNCNGAGGEAAYVAILGPTNALPGLWTVLDSNGVSCLNVTNKPFGVVEVNQIQTNGVQLWISVTNSVTNNVLTGLGRLYANILDTNNVPHEVFSAPGLIQSNVFQHVALTYNTNTGIANLYYDGTNVASTNLGVFVPNTTGDFLLGKDMSTVSNNFFWGRMDEMSIYSRYLSDAEIAAIFNISASTSNRNIGKFNPAVTPALSLAEAQAVFGGVTNLLFAVNDAWQSAGFTIKPTSNTLPVQITGLEPGVLLDSFTITEQPPGNLYYLPEQALNALVGSNAFGNWTLEIRDSRTGLISTNADLISWELQFILQTNTPIPLQLGPQSPGTNTIPPGQIAYFVVNVPDWARDATNILVSSTPGPVSLLFNQTAPPLSGSGIDFTFVNNNTAGSVTISNRPPSNPLLLPGQSYYLAVTNGGTTPATVVVEVDFDITTLTNGAPYTASFNTNDLERPFIFNVTSNASEATFQLLQLTGNADLVLRKGLPIPSLTSADYGSFSGSNSDETIYVLTNSAPVPLSAGTWYLDVIKREGLTSDSNVIGATMRYAVLAKELDPNPLAIPPMPNIINLSNRVPFTWTAGPGTALTNFFRFGSNNFSSVVPTNIGLHFELYNQSGNGDLTVQTDAPPLFPPFFQSSRQPSGDAEFIFIHTNAFPLTNLVTDWYLGVPNNETNPIQYTILAVIDTNVMPSFPAAEGAGSDTRGGSFGTNVYHVISLSDSSIGSLRYGLNLIGTNGGGTIVFDVGGTINLVSPLYITNSFITLAGQTSPGGITIAGASTYIENANDIILRYLRFRPQVTSGNVPVWANGFEGQQGGTISAGGYVTGWHVDSGSIDLLTAGVAFGANPVPQGTNFIDIDGSSAGQVSTNFPTLAGTNYILSFYYTKNPNAGANFPSAAILVGGNTLGTITASNANAWTSLGWMTTSFVFTATSPSTSLVLSSLDPSSDPSGVMFDGFTVSRAVSGTNGIDGLQLTNASNIIIDHVSSEYAANDDLSVLNSSNVTVQWSMLANSQNQANPLTGGSEVLDGAGEVTLHHNLYANNYSANPHIGDDITLDFVNNVIFNWGIFAGISTNDPANDPGGFTNYLNYSANYAIAWTNSLFTNVAFWGGSTNTYIFQTDNVIDTNLNFVLDGANTSWGMFSNQFTEFGAPFIIQPTAPDEAFIAYERVLDFAGTAIGRRDGTDRGIVQGVRFEPVNTNTTPGFLSGMVAWWKGESNTLDSIGGNNGVFINGAAYQPGEVNTAFSLNGSSSYVLVQSANPSLNVGTGPGMTIEGWINPTTVSREELLSEWERILGSGSGSDVGALFFIEPTGTLNANIEDTTRNAHTITSAPNALTANVWQHVAVTYDTNSGIAALYVNGAVVISQSFGSFTPQTSYTNLVIGARTYLGSELAPISVFSGGMDEWTIYSRALSQCEIQAIYNSGTNGKAPLLAAGTGNTNVVFSPNPPFKDADQDGIPDFWEMTLGENPTNFSPTADYNGDGITDLEDYLNWLGVPHALTVTNNPVAVDLYSIAGETGNLVFGVQNGTNGTVYLTNSPACNAPGNGDTIAIFTPTNNFGGGSNGGFGSFTFMVTNMDTVAYFGPVTVSVFCSSVPITNANVAPFIYTNPPDITMLELTTDQVLNAAVPTNGITYTLPPNDPPWAAINPNTGLITLTPGECVGSNIYTIFTVAQDTNVPPDFATNQFNVTVLETNLAPYFTNVPPYSSNTPPNITNFALATIVVTNGAADADCSNEVTLTNYQVFIAGASPASNLVNNASISTNGIITWTPTPAQTGLFTVTTIVTDYDPTAANSPTLSATNVFYIMVLAPPLPAAFTQPAQAVIPGSAQLNGMATPGGYPSIAWFQWGTNTSYGNQTPPVSVGSGFSVVYTNAVITGLTPGVVYHFRLVLSNAVGIVTGFDQMFVDAYVAGWGANQSGQINIPSGLSNAVAIDAAYNHSIALLNNETVLAWGDNTEGQTNVPASLTNVLAIAGGQYYSMALRNNGTVTSWGSDVIPQQTNVPPGLANVVLIAGGTWNSFALQGSGTIVAWGANFFGLTNVPGGLNGNVVEVAGGLNHAVIIKNDGTLVAWGDNSAGETNVPASATNVVQIACGEFHSLALRADGTVVAWGDNSDGQTVVPPGLSNVVAVAAGDFDSMALRSDGTIAEWGDDSAGESSVPIGLSNVVAISAGYFHSLALTALPFSSSTNIVILPLTNGVPETNTEFSGQTVFYRVNVPGNVDFDTNSLFPVSGANVNVWFTTNAPPSITKPNDFLLIGNTNAGTAYLSNSGSPQLIDNTTYYLGVQNTNSFAVSYAIEVGFHFVVTGPSTNTSPVTIVQTNISGTNGFLLTWFAPSNDLFEVQWTPGLLPTTWTTFTNPLPVTYDPTYAFVNATNTRFEFFDDGSQTGGFDTTRFYRIILLNGVAPPTVLSNGVPQTNGIPPGTTVFYQINVPTNALFATNSLLSAQGGNLNIWFSTNSPPTINNPNDSLLITNAASGSSVLGTNGSPHIVDGGTYYLGVQNTNSGPVVYGLSVNFDLTTAPPATNTVPISSIINTNINGTNGFLLVWFAPSNDLFQVQWTPSLLPTTWTIFTNPPVITYDPTYASVNPTNTEFDFFDDGSQTGGFGPTRFYRLILLNPSAAAPLAIPLTNGVPLNYTTVAGGTNFFSFTVTQTNAAVLFELYNLTGNGIMYLQVSNLPVTPPYFTNSAGPGTNYQQIVLRTNTSTLPNINATSWFLGVPNQTATSINYTIRAVLPTNGLLISGLPINTLVSQSGGTNLQLTWSPTVSGELYEIRTNSNLTTSNWVALTDIFATGTSINFTDPNPIGAIPALFFEVVQVP